MSKTASDTKLGALHNALATVIAEQVKEVAAVTDEDGEVTGEYYTATPALLTVAARFLKDNDITCEVEESEGLTDLQKTLAEKRKRSSKITSISSIPHLPPEQANG